MAHAQTTRPAVATYVRSARPEGSSHFEARTDALRRYAEGRGWPVDAAFAEARPWGVSDAMLQALTEYDVVLVEGWSRLSRSMAGTAEVLRRLQTARVRVVVARPGAGGVVADEQQTAELEQLLIAALADTERDAHGRRDKARIAAARARREDA